MHSMALEPAVTHFFGSSMHVLTQGNLYTLVVITIMSPHLPAAFGAASPMPATVSQKWPTVEMSEAP
jgi:hypothetical protein